MLLGLTNRLFYCSSYLQATVSLASTKALSRPDRSAGFNNGRSKRSLLKALVVAHCDSKESFEGRYEQL